MKRRLLSIFLIFTMILLMLPNVTLTTGMADNAPWNGLGTMQNPYEINNRADFLAIANAVNGGDSLEGKYFKQMQEIDLGGAAEPWPTIGITINNATHQFRGVYNGNDFNITGLYVNRSDDDAGLFGYVGPGGIIRNVRVKNGYVRGTYWCAGIAARNYGIVEFSSFSGEVYGSQQFVGGVVGDNHGGGIVRYCCNEGYIEFDQIGGGVVGRNSGSTVENCYNRGDVYAKNVVRGYAGGVVGENTANSTIDNCYTDGWVEGNMACGAVAGANGDGSTVINCFYPDDMEEAGLPALGSTMGSTVDNVTPKSDEQFGSGEVAWELSQGTHGDGWGQSLADGDMHPHFLDQPDKDHETTPIFRVSFSTVDPNLLPPDGFKSFYGDPGYSVKAPPLPEGACWYVVGTDYVEFNGDDIRENIDLYAGKRILFAGEDGIVHRLTYSTEAQTVDLDIYLKYAEGGPYSEGRFEYTITEDQNDLNGTGTDDIDVINNILLSEDKKTLTVPAGTSVRDGGYTLKITAHEKDQYIVPLALTPFGTNDVELTVNIVIDKATPVITVKPTASEINYGTALSGSTLSGGTANHPTTSAEVSGTFAWDDNSIKPTVNESAIKGYYVTFTPNSGDEINYNPVTIMVTLAVNKVDPTNVIPPDTINSIYNGMAEYLIDENQPGSADGGTVKYWLSPVDDPNAKPPENNSEYSSTIPSRANAGTYYIWYKVIGDENHNDFQDENCRVKAVISPCPLNIPEQHVTYNGGNTFTLELNGVSVTGEDSPRTVIATLTAADKNADDYTYSAAAEPAANQYTVKLSNSNYEVGGNAGKLVIDKLPVVLKWTGQLAFLHDDRTHTVTAEVANGIKGDTFKPEYANNSADAVGVYEAEVTNPGNTNYTLNGAQNVKQPWRIFENSGNITLTANRYTITYGDPLTLTATITAENVNTASDTVEFFVNCFQSVGVAPVVRNGSKYTATLTIDNATSHENFSLGANAVRAEYNGSENGIYAITVNVNPKPITATISNAEKTYDGNNVASGIEIKPVDVETWDKDDVFVTADICTYSDAKAADKKTVTAANVKLTGDQSGNYTIANTIRTTGKITPKPIKLEWRGLTGLVYTGSPVNVNATATELLPDDKCTVTVTNNRQTNAGDYIAEATRLSNSNYTLPDDDTKVQKYTIEKADLYIPDQTHLYSDTSKFTARVNGVTRANGSSEKVDVELSANNGDVGDYTYSVSDKEAGTYTASSKSINYQIAGGAILTITKVDLTYTAPVSLNQTYSGVPQELVTKGEANGGEMQYGLSRDGTYYPDVPMGIEIGTYIVWYKVIGDKNHNDTAPRYVRAAILSEDASADDPSGPETSNGGTGIPNTPTTSDGGISAPNSSIDPNSPNDSNDPTVSDVGASNDPNNSSSDSDTTKQPDSSIGSDNPNTGFEINFVLGFLIMCFCISIVAAVSRKAK